MVWIKSHLQVASVCVREEAEYATGMAECEAALAQRTSLGPCINILGSPESSPQLIGPETSVVSTFRGLTQW
jgi:hypothetical protein